MKNLRRISSKVSIPALLFAVLAVQGCADQVPVDQMSCPAAEFEPYVGQPESALAGLEMPDGARIIHPGDMVTKDFLEDRLNILIDEAGLITMVYCG